MATQQDMAQQRSKARKQPEMARSDRDTGERDEVYGLLSVAYHALKGAETYGIYAGDAERAGDDELADFFEQCCDEEVARAEKAKSLLMSRIQDAEGEGYEDEEEED